MEDPDDPQFRPSSESDSEVPTELDFSDGEPGEDDGDRIVTPKAQTKAPVREKLKGIRQSMRETTPERRGSSAISGSIVPSVSATYALKAVPSPFKRPGKRNEVNQTEIRCVKASSGAAFACSCYLTCSPTKPSSKKHRSKHLVPIQAAHPTSSDAITRVSASHHSAHAKKSPVDGEPLPSSLPIARGRALTSSSTKGHASFHASAESLTRHAPRLPSRAPSGKSSIMAPGLDPFLLDIHGRAPTLPTSRGRSSSRVPAENPVLNAHASRLPSRAPTLALAAATGDCSRSRSRNSAHSYPPSRRQEDPIDLTMLSDSGSFELPDFVPSYNSKGRLVKIKDEPAEQRLVVTRQAPSLSQQRAERRTVFHGVELYPTNGVRVPSSCAGDQTLTSARF